MSVSQVRSGGCFTVSSDMMCCFLYTFACPCLVQVSQVKVGGALVGQCRDFRSPCPVSPVGGSSASALCTASLRRQCISRELWSKIGAAVRTSRLHASWRCGVEAVGLPVLFKPAGTVFAPCGRIDVLGAVSRSSSAATGEEQRSRQVRSTLLSPSYPPHWSDGPKTAQPSLIFSV